MGKSIYKCVYPLDWIPHNCEPIWNPWISPFHNGQLGTEKIFKKVELGVSMASLTSNLENVCQKSGKKSEKKVLKMMGFEPLISIKQRKNGLFH